MPAVKNIGGVAVVHWNPRRSLGAGTVTRRLSVRRKINNFGDLLGPPIVSSLVREAITNRGPRRRLFTVGSVLHLAQTDDVVWGSGRNGKVAPSSHQFGRLDVRAVRGPLTRDFLLARGLDVPAVYGDPALLLPLLRPDLRKAALSKRTKVLLVPNLNDRAAVADIPKGPTVLDPTSGMESCLLALVQSECVITSSLHGMIVAEAFGVPTILVRSPSENSFKYDDYFLGTGRSAHTSAPNFEAAYKDGSRTSVLHWESLPLLNSFPHDLWSQSAAPGRSGKE